MLYDIIINEKILFNILKMKKYESPTIEMAESFIGSSVEGVRTLYEENFFVVGEIALYVVAVALMWLTLFIAAIIKVPAANLEPVSK